MGVDPKGRPDPFMFHEDFGWLEAPFVATDCHATSKTRFKVGTLEYTFRSMIATMILYLKFLIGFNWQGIFFQNLIDMCVSIEVLLSLEVHIRNLLFSCGGESIIRFFDRLLGVGFILRGIVGP